LRNIIESGKQAFVDQIGCSMDNLGVAIDSAAGLEGHEWIRTVRQTLSVPVHQFTDSAVQVWLSDEKHKDLCKPLVDFLRGHAHLMRAKEPQEKIEKAVAA
jgi:hypothetical protein